MGAEKKSALYLYIGYPKTGTTWIQANELAHNPEILLLGKCGYPHCASYSDDSAKDFSYRFLLFDQELSLESALEEFLPYFVERINAAKNRVALFCDESVLDVDSNYNDNDIGDTLERLKAFFDKVCSRTGRELKVMVTLREQKSYLHSIYKQMWEDNHIYQGVKTFSEFIARGVGEPGRDQFGAIDYDTQLNRLVRVFGAENVGVFLYENFRDDPNTFLDELCAFAGCARMSEQRSKRLGSSSEGNRSQRDGEFYVLPRDKYVRENCRTVSRVIWMGQKFFRLARRLRLCRGPAPSFEVIFGWLDQKGLIPVSRGEHIYKMSAEEAEAVDAVFAEGNRRVARRFELPLADAGYALE